jgi:hypothetical protein
MKLARLQEIFENKDPGMAPGMAPACGLYFYCADYATYPVFDSSEDVVQISEEAPPISEGGSTKVEKKRKREEESDDEQPAKKESKQEGATSKPDKE